MKKNILRFVALLSILTALTMPMRFASAADYTKAGVIVNDLAVYRTSVKGDTVNKTTILLSQINEAEVALNITNYYPNGNYYPPSPSDN